MTPLELPRIMPDMTDETSMAVSLERISGSVSRVEVKMDVLMTDLHRRVSDGEEDRRALHAAHTGLASTVVGLSARQDASESRVAAVEHRLGGAFSKYVPPIIASLALGLTLFTIITKL